MHTRFMDQIWIYSLGAFKPALYMNSSDCRRLTSNAKTTKDASPTFSRKQMSSVRLIKICFSSLLAHCFRSDGFSFAVLNLHDTTRRQRRIIQRRWRLLIVVIMCVVPHKTMKFAALTKKCIVSLVCGGTFILLLATTYDVAKYSKTFYAIA